MRVSDQLWDIQVIKFYSVFTNLIMRISKYVFSKPCPKLNLAIISFKLWKLQIPYFLLHQRHLLFARMTPVRDTMRRCSCRVWTSARVTIQIACHRAIGFMIKTWPSVRVRHNATWDLNKSHLLHVFSVFQIPVTSLNGCPCPLYDCQWEAYKTKSLLVLNTWGYDEASKMLPSGELDASFQFDFNG